MIALKHLSINQILSSDIQKHNNWIYNLIELSDHRLPHHQQMAVSTYTTSKPFPLKFKSKKNSDIGTVLQRLNH